MFHDTKISLFSENSALLAVNTSKNAVCLLLFTTFFCRNWRFSVTLQQKNVVARKIKNVKQTKKRNANETNLSLVGHRAASCRLP